jgi:hypothetical protein
MILLCGHTALARYVPQNLDEGGGEGGSGQSALYAPGGPRSAQFTLKLLF